MRLPRLQLPDGEIDLEAQECHRLGKTFSLEPIEVRLLNYMASKKGNLISLDELHREVWGFASQVVTRAGYFAIRRLRQRLEVDPKSPLVLIGSERTGFGIRFVPKTFSLIGRDHELNHIHQHLVPGALVVITGPAGVGKSRLISEITRSCLSIVVNAQGVVDGNELAIMIARALEHHDTHQPIETLKRALSLHPSFVLAIDHLEDLDPSFFPILMDWQTHAPHVRWLVASRTPLLLPKAFYIPLAPLGLSEAKALFTQRWQANGTVQPLSSDELMELLPYLDGLPLAIEICAWQLRTVPIRYVQKAFTEASDLPLTGPHGSLEVSIAISFERLSHEERIGIARLCELNAAVPLEAALATMAISTTGLSRLVDHGLIRIDVSNKEALYTPFCTVRWFVQKRQGYMDGCENLVRWWLDTIEGSAWVASWAAQITQYALLGAAQMLVQQGKIELGGRMAIICLRHGYQYGMTPAHQLLLKSFEGLELDPLTDARLKWQQAILAESDKVLLESFYNLKNVMMGKEIALAALHLARTRFARADIEGANQAMAWARQASDGGDIALEISAAHIARSQGRLSDAIHIAEQAMGLARKNPGQLPFVLGLLAMLHKDQGLCDEALALTTEAVSLVKEKTGREVAQIWNYHADVNGLLGRVDETRAALEKVIHLLKPKQNPAGLAAINAIINLAWLDLDDNPEKARQLLLEYYSIAVQKPARFATFQIFLELARLRCGHPPTNLPMDTLLTMTCLQMPADIAYHFGFCAEIAARSGQYSKADEYIAKMESTIKTANISARIDVIRRLNFAKALRETCR